MKKLRIKISTAWIGSFIGILGLLFWSCEEATDWEFQPGENGRLVVESILTDELQRQEVFLSLSYDDLNGTAPSVSGANVQLSDGQNSIDLVEDSNRPGLYLSPIAFAAQKEVDYQLTIDWEGQTYQASSAMVPVLPPSQGFTFRQVGETDSMTINQVPPFYMLNEQAMYAVEIDWSHLTNIAPTLAQTFYYTFRTIDVSELFRPEAENLIFPRGSIFRVKKHGLNEEFAAYYRALAIEKEWQGGFYNEVSDNLPTNISNGGLGFFGVCAVWKDSLIVQ